MDNIGIDLHQRESQLCILTEDGEIIEQRIRTTPERFTAVLGGHPKARMLLEASTESEWVARHLEGLGHQVIIGDPTFAPMYATRSRRVKTDRRDARALMEACKLGAYRPAHRLSDAQRHVRAELAVRDSLVRTRTRYVTLIKTLVRRTGRRLPPGEPETTAARLTRLDLSADVRAELAPLVQLLAPLNEHIAAADQRLTAIVQRDPVVARLCTVPGIGPVTAAAFVATIDDVTRFHSAHQLEAYLGLVPSERSSGERQHRGRITKTGNPRLRWLLVEAAWRIWRARRPEVAHLRTWVHQLAQRRGRRIAIVALARRLAGILYAMWRDQQSYRPVCLPSTKEMVT
jgi:transposase